jgi:hypothetical protein
MEEWIMYEDLFGDLFEIKGKKEPETNGLCTQEDVWDTGTTPNIWQNEVPDTVWKN